MNTIYIILAAGGNATAIEVLDAPLTREKYSSRGKELDSLYAKKYEVEQVGFLIKSNGSFHFEMAGGEFCGNAARAATLLISKLINETSVSFTMSSTTRPVAGKVDGDFVSVTFTDLPCDISPVTVLGGEAAKIVDLGGIVHVILQSVFPKNAYKSVHGKILDELNLRGRAAVGVTWVEKNGDEILIHPVVWVRDVDTFYYESSCGSGSIAASAVTKESIIKQPSGGVINVSISGNKTLLSSRMEIIHEDHR